MHERGAYTLPAWLKTDTHTCTITHDAVTFELCMEEGRELRTCREWVHARREGGKRESAWWEVGREKGKCMEENCSNLLHGLRENNNNKNSFR